MSCGSGQIDVNVASAGAIAEAFGLAPAVADRVVAGRLPYYLTLQHLKYVAGIGPGELRRIQGSGRACVGLPSTPPPTDQYVCVPGDGRLDLNRPRENYDALVAMYGRPTADRIVANSPYSGFAHVVAETVGGAGGGRQSRNADRLCVTPPTMEFNSVTYGWISAAGGVVTHTDASGRRFRLSVPAGVVDGAGLWGSTAPVAADAVAPGLVATDAHLHGTWSGLVHVGSPPDPALNGLGPAWEHAVLHFPNSQALSPENALTIQANEGIAVVDGLVTVATDSLSPFLAIAIPAAIIVGLVYQPFADWLTSLVRGFLGVGEDNPSCSPDITDQNWNRIDIRSEGSALNGSPSNELVHHCVEPVPNNTTKPHSGQWKLVGNSGAVVPVLEQSGADIVSGGFAGNLLQALFFSLPNALNTGPGVSGQRAWLTPGTELHVIVEGQRVPASQYVPGEVLYHGEPWIVLPPTVLFAMLGLMPVNFKNYGIQVMHDAIVECAPGYLEVVSGGASASDVGELFAFFESCAGNAALRPNVRDFLQDIGATERQLTTAFARLRWIVVAATAAVAVVDVVRAKVDSGPIRMTFRLPPHPPAAAPDTQATDPDVDSNPPAGYLIKSPGTPRSFYVVERVASHVPNGDTYVCLSQRVPTQFEVDDVRFDELVSQVSDEDASCPSGVEHLGTRSIGARDADGHLLSEGFLIRMESGKAFLVDEGYLVPLFSGPEHFPCLARTRLTWDLVTDRELYEADIDRHPVLAAIGCA